MTQQEVINFFVDDEPAFSATEINQGAYTVELEEDLVQEKFFIVEKN